MNSNHDAAWGFAEADRDKDHQGTSRDAMYMSPEEREISAIRAERDAWERLANARGRELELWHATPVVPGRDHEIMRAQRDAFRDALAAVMSQLGRAAGGPSESAVFAHARGLLAEAGVVPASVEEYRRAFEEWAKRHED